MAQCIQCGGEGKTTLYRFGNTRDAEGTGAGCIYSSFNACLEDNNPRNISVSPDCLVFVNDNGNDLKSNQNGGIAASLFFNTYGDPNQQKPIPSIYASPTSTNFINGTTDVTPLGEKNQRLWGYDFSANTAYYLDSVNHRGTDIAVTGNKLFLGCDYIPVPVLPPGGSAFQAGTIPSITINEYNYTISNNDPDTFVKQPTKTYRFVTEQGNLLAADFNIHPTLGQSSVSKLGGGNGISELEGLGNDLGVVDDRTLVFSDKQGHIYVAELDNLWTGETVFAANNVQLPTNPNLTNHVYGGQFGDSFTYTDGLYNCSEDHGLVVHTVVVKLIVKMTPESDKTMGDIIFIPNDPVNNGDPTIIASVQLNTTAFKRFVRFKYPTDLNNITVQNFNDYLTIANAPAGAVALFKNTGTGQFYTVAARKRYDIDFVTLSFSNSLNTQITTYDNQGFLQSINTGPLYGWGWRGASQPVDCVTSSAYTYNCTIDGCVSVLGNSGTFASESACTSSCISYSCSTICACPEGFTYNNVTENCESLSAATINTPLSLNTSNSSSQFNSQDTQFYTKQGGSWSLIATKNGPSVGTATDASGFWGNLGSYLLNSPLNTYGVWNNTFNDWTPLTQNWYGTSKCLDITGQTIQSYLVGVGGTPHIRITVDNVIEVDTTTGVNGFDPGSVLSGNDPETQPATTTYTQWHVFKIDLTPGLRSITIEGASTAGVPINKAFAFDIVGPFSPGTYDTNAEFVALTHQTYSANTIFSTKDMMLVQASSNCFLDKPVVPYILGSTLESTFPDPWWGNSGLANSLPDFNMVFSQGLPAGHVPGWGDISNTLRLFTKPSYSHGTLPWFASNSNYTDPDTGAVTPRNLLSPLGFLGVSEDEQQLPINAQSLPVPYNSNIHGLLTTCQQEGSNQLTGVYGPVRLFKKTNYPGREAIHIGGFAQNNYSFLGRPVDYQWGNTNAFGWTATNWREVIDFLNAQGLTVSNIVDPNTGIAPVIDYDADYWTVLHAVQAYWTPSNPTPAGSNLTLADDINNSGNAGVYEAPVYIHSIFNFVCSCSSTAGYLNTQVNHCSAPSVYDACSDSCVATTDCSLNYLLGFSGGCVEILGTGQTGTYSTSAECETNCFSGFTYYQCGDNGCTLSTNNTVTPYTSLTQCQEVCTSYSCSTLGCETYNVGGGGGTGGTFTTLLDCDITCKSYNCTNGFYGAGCQEQIGTGGTFTELTACTATCVSYECLSYGCWGYEGTGYTYTDLSACTASCQTTACTYDGCVTFNTPPPGTTPTPGIGNTNTYYGTGTSITPNLYTSSTECIANCASWGCAEVALLSSSRQPDIYVFYDTTSMNVDAIQAITAISAWTQTIPGYTGFTYHSFLMGERYLQWATSPWDAFSGSNVSNHGWPQTYMEWAIEQGIQTQSNGEALIRDNSTYSAPVGASYGQTFIGTNGVTYSYGNNPGPAPTATTSDNAIVIMFCDESHNVYTDIFSAQNWGTAPKPGWISDYNSFVNRWNALTVKESQFILYPTSDNPNIGVMPGNVKDLAIHAYAAIYSGNTGNNDGLWLPGTAPNNDLPLQPGDPNYTAAGNFNNLLNVSNPYWPTYGNLKEYNWDVDVSLTPWNPGGFSNYLNIAIQQGTTANTNSGCFSAATLPTVDFPFSSVTDCNSGFTYWNGQLVTCSGYKCSDTGCILVTGTTNTDWQFDTLAQCTAACQSYICTTTGCTTFNLPNYGTGGTFMDLSLCSTACTSYNCETWDASYGPQSTWDGCLSQIGTGGTFYSSSSLIFGPQSNYSACTGSCISYNCSGACETNGTGLSASTGTCVSWPNTGGTYTTLSSCTANCQTNWWCVPETVIDTCDNRTVQYNLINPNVGGLQQAVDTIDVTSPLYIGNYIASNYNSINISTISFQDATGPVISNACIGNDGLPIVGATSIESNLIPGGPWFVWDDFVIATQSQGIGVTNQMSWTQVTQQVTGFYNPTGLTNTFPFWVNLIQCQCQTLFNNVVCTTDGIPPTANATGPYATSGTAINECYSVSYNCVDETFTNTCSGTTQLPGQFSSLTQVHDYVSTNLPNTNLADVSYESYDLQTLASGCVGPNGYALYQLEAISYPQLNNGINYQSYNTFVTALSGQGASTLTPGQSYSSINDYIITNSGSSISLCQEPCICQYYPCYCEEVNGTGGTYNTLAECNIQCDCIPTGTSWNCVNQGPYEPICDQKPFIGLYYSQNDVVDHFRQNSPNVSFATERFVYDVQSFNPIVMGPVLSYTNSTPSVWGIFSASSYDWWSCYHYEIPDRFYPFTYIKSISHPLISGGSGTLTSGGWSYNNWSSFYNAVSNAGVNINANMTFSAVCDTIDTTLGSNANPASSLLGCEIDFAYCCVDEECYCYELYVTGGTYNTEPECERVCCPEPRTGYTCDSVLQDCVLAGPPVPPNSYVFYTDYNQCVNDLPINCPPIMYDCITGVTVYSCDPSQPIDQVSPGTLGSNGTPFTVNSPGYPFSSFTTTASQFGGTVIGHAEEVLTNPIYLDPSVPFSSVTYEVSGTTNNPYNPPVNSACLGPNGWPVLRTISVAHPLVNNAQPYYSWGDFVSAANSAGYPFPTSLPIQDWGWNEWIFTTQPCDCTPNSCICEAVIGFGQYYTLAACELDCCVPRTSYNCTITGCVDPGDGSGTFFGPNALINCISICKEWECNPNLTPNDPCGNRDEIPYPGSGINDIVAYISDPQNPILQNSPYSQMKFEIANFCHPPNTVNPCYGQNGLSLAYINYMEVFQANNSYTIPPGTQFYSWLDLINGINQYCVNCTGTFTNQSQIQITPQGSAGVDCFDGSNVCFYNTLPGTPVTVPQFIANMGCCDCSGTTECDCLEIIGTGHSGTYIYTQAGYNLCVSACCDEQNFELCDVFLTVQGEGIYELDHLNGDITQASQITNNTVNNDISMWIDGPLNSLLWLYDNNTIREHLVTLSPWSLTFNRNINTSGFIGKGLATYNQNTLISADNWVRLLDITPPALNATATLLFNLPGWCLGDIIWDPTSQQFLIAYSDLPVTANNQRIGKFNFAGNIQDEYLIPPGVLAVDEKIDGLFKKGSFGICKNYAITTKGRVFNILDPINGSLGLAPVPITSINDVAVTPTTPVTGAANAEGPAIPELNCGCISQKPTYNCIQNPTSNPPTSNCIDPGDGSGQYTPLTASLNGYASALLECQDDCPFSCITWDCIPGTVINECENATYTLPYPQVSSDGEALDYITNGPWPNSWLTPFSDIKFEVPQEIAGTCLGPNDLPLVRIKHILSPWNGQQYYSWAEFIDALNIHYSGFLNPNWPGFPYTSNLSQVNQLLSQNNYANLKIVVEPCECIAEPCHCIPVIGTTGQYLTESLCLTDCCPIEPLEESYECSTVTLPNQFNSCIPCQGPNCPYTTTLALQNGFANALQMCLASCQEGPMYGWKCEVPGQPCVQCPNPTQNGPCYMDPHECFLACTTIEPNPCPPLDLTSPYYVNQQGFCAECQGGSFAGHPDCLCCNQRPLLGNLVRYCGTQEEVAVQISLYTGTKLNVVTSQMVRAIDDITSQIKRPTPAIKEAKCVSCGGTYEENASCLVNGCLSITRFEEFDKSTVCWTSPFKPDVNNKTYDCIDGNCIEIENGRFNSISDCIKECNDIVGNKSITITGDKSMMLPPEPVTEFNSRVVKATVVENNFYVCQTVLNPVVGENQQACVPTDTFIDGGFTDLVSCLNSGCGGYLITKNTSKLEVNGVEVKSNEILPIGMCCETHITTATTPLTLKDCNSYCCDGDDIWYPLYNAFGINNVINSSLSYTKGQISQYVTSDLVEIITNTATYTAKGYNTLLPYSRKDINACGGEIIGYINAEAVYATIADAVNQAGKQGCMGYHTHVVDGVLGYMACESHDVATNITPNTRRSYETQSLPPSESTPVRSGFVTTPAPRTTPTAQPTPRTTPTRPASGGGMSSGGGGGGSYGGGY